MTGIVRLQLMDGGHDRALFGFLLRLLTGKRRNLGAEFGHLIEQELALSVDQCGICVGGRREVGDRIISAGQRRIQPRDVQLFGEEIIVHVIAFRRVHGRIELDQHVARLDHLPVLHPNGPHHPGLERLDDFGTTARNDFSGCRRNDVDRASPGPDQRHAEKQHDCGPDRTTNRRRRCFDDFKRGRQERQALRRVFRGHAEAS